MTQIDIFNHYGSDLIFSFKYDHQKTGKVENALDVRQQLSYKDIIIVRRLYPNYDIHTQFTFAQNVIICIFLYDPSSVLLFLLETEGITK